jgi:hypothetical protein
MSLPIEEIISRYNTDRQRSSKEAGPQSFALPRVVAVDERDRVGFLSRSATCLAKVPCCMGLPVLLINLHCYAMAVVGAESFA